MELKVYMPKTYKVTGPCNSYLLNQMRQAIIWVLNQLLLHVATINLSGIYLVIYTLSPGAILLKVLLLSLCPTSLLLASRKPWCGRVLTSAGSNRIQVHPITVPDVSCPHYSHQQTGETGRHFGVFWIIVWADMGSIHRGMLWLVSGTSGRIWINHRRVQ